jgi:hypothetical protein
MRWALALLLAGCGPSVLWHGHSPDRTRRALVVDEGRQQRVVLDGRPQQAWEAIGFTHLRWTSRGPVYPALANGRWHLVHADERGPGFEAIGEVHVAGDRVAYAARDERGWRLVVEGALGPPFESLRGSTFVFGAEGRRYAYVGRDERGAHAVIDGAVGPAYEHVERLAFGGKGALVAYVGEREDAVELVIDGRVAARVDEVIELALARDEPRWAALVLAQGAYAIVRDRGDPLAVPFGTRELAIGADGAHLAWVTSAGARVDVWLDGERVGTQREVERLTIVRGEVVYVTREARGRRVVQGRRAGPLVEEVEALVVSPAGHVGYVAVVEGERRVVIDGEVRGRGEWAGALTLAERSDRYAFVLRREGRRFVVTPDGRHVVARPFVDTLVLDPDGAHWGIAMAEPAARQLVVVVDGEAVARLDLDEVTASMMQGRDLASAVRAVVAGELARHTR